MKRILKQSAVIASVLLMSFAACQDDTTSSSKSTSSTGQPGPTSSGTGGNGGGPGSGASSSTGGPAEICDDGIDNDGDLFIDCLPPPAGPDFDCPCPTDPENTDALCDDGEDNDMDGKMDCADPSCHGHPDVLLCKEQAADCDDTMDNDEDGYTDCEDRDCLKAGACNDIAGDGIEAGPTECEDNADDAMNANGFIDCADFTCQDSHPTVCAEESMAQCIDTMDNNDNTYVDCDDFSCQYNSGACPETTDAECSDNMDNETPGDGFIDCQDFSCQRSETQMVCEGNARTCADGIDNDNDGSFDCDDFACRCCGSPTDGCSGSQYDASTCEPCP